MNPFALLGSRYQVLQLIFKGTATESNGVVRNLQSLFYYYWSPSTGGTQPTQSQKTTLVTTATTGFKAVVITPLLGVLNARWTSVGIFARWLDVVTDPLVNVSAFTTAGSVGSAASSLPLDVHVTVRKATGVRGKNWRGNWKFAPVDSSYTAKDELIAGVTGPPATGQAAWSAIRSNFSATITDGTSTMTPCMISERQSQLRLNPTNIVGAALTSGTLINSTLGENKRRKERPSASF